MKRIAILILVLLLAGCSANNGDPVRVTCELACLVCARCEAQGLEPGDKVLIDEVEEEQKVQEE